MTAPKAMLTSQEFAERAGVSTSTVSKWLRSGKVIGVKQSGKWMISADQLTTEAPTKPEQPEAKVAAPKPVATRSNASNPTDNPRAYSIEEFSAMTYLTTFGVERFLKQGRLTGRKNEAGKWVVDHANLDQPDIQRLLRK